MPLIEDKAFCIRRWDFSETSQTVSLFTRDHGVIRALAKGAKRARGSFSGGLDVLQAGNLVAIVKNGSELATLTQWSAERGHPVLRRSLAANRAAWWMADLVHHMISHDDPHPEVYDALAEALDSMQGGTAPGIALLRFQWCLLRATGVEPCVDRDAESGGPLDATAATLAFSPGRGGLVADTGGGDRWRVRRDTARALQAVARGDEPAEAIAVDRANRLLAAYVREILGSEPAAYRWAFGDGRGPRE